MAKRSFAVFLILSLICAKCRGFTHWVVTENGRIQSQLDSPFHLRRPYDLIALLDQETRRANITVLYNEMIRHKIVIDKKWGSIEGAAEVEARIYGQDAYCLQAGKLLSEVDLYNSIASNGSDRFDIQFSNVVTAAGSYLIPDCAKFSSVPYSMCAFEHLDVMLRRSELNIPQEISLNNILPVESVDVFGHAVSVELHKNVTSWVHYNLAVIYWRIKGNAQNAIECGRRAVHFVSRQYKDIPLLTLADVLHQSQHPKDAAVLLYSALMHSPNAYMNYIALGNTFAVQYDYNRSITYYNIALSKNADIDNIAASKYALLCHKSLDEGLKQLHDSLQTILTDLHNYHGLQQQWLRLQERLLWEQAPIEPPSSGEKHNTGQRCVHRQSDDGSQPTITCEFSEHDLTAQFQTDVTLNFQKLLHNVETETKKISEQIARSKNRRATPSLKKWNPSKVSKASAGGGGSKSGFSKKRNNGDSKMPPVLHPAYPLSLAPSRNLHFDAAGWPTRSECILWNLPIKEHDDLDLPVFLPPENKGYQVTKMLTDYIGLPSGKEHNLPWHPPNCKDTSRDVEKLYLSSSLRQSINTIVLKNHPIMKEHFLSYINNGKGEESEVGQRIVTAMQKKSGPDWVLATLASLYWRVRSNTKNSLQCLDFALKNIPKETSDVVLVSISSILYQLGLINEATKYAKLAFKVNFNEPGTNFLLAMLHYRSNNPILAMYYMKNVLRIEPDYYDGKADELLRTWSCRLKLGAYEDLRPTNDKETADFNGKDDHCDLPFGKGHQDQGAHCNDKSKMSQTANDAQKQSDSDPLAMEIANQPQVFHMKVTLGSGAAVLGDFYISVTLSNDPLPEAILNVQDTSGTYAVSTQICLSMRKIDWYLFQINWQASASRNINVKKLLKPLPSNIENDLKPECAEPSKAALILDRLTRVLKIKLPDIPEEPLIKYLRLVTGDTFGTTLELGTKLHLALLEHKNSWLLLSSAALYWRIVGDGNKAVTCLKQALVYVPNDIKDIPLIGLANVYQKAELYDEALEIALLAIETNPNYFINHFAVGNIHDVMGNLEKALSFYRATLALEANYIPAQTRIKEMLCSLLFDDNGIMKDVTNVE